MWRIKSQDCGIKNVNNRGRINLTKKAEDEVKKLSFLLKKYSYLSSYEKCTFCRHNIEAMNDFCEIKEEHTICYEYCDQFEEKNTTEELKKRRESARLFHDKSKEIGRFDIVWKKEED